MKKLFEIALEDVENTLPLSPVDLDNVQFDDVPDVMLDGVYSGIISGYVLTFTYLDKTYNIKLNTGVRGRNIQTDFEIKNHRIV